MSVERIEEFLEHHGVKGQKWGVRRKKSGTEKSGKLTTNSKNKSAPSTKHLTNQELKSRIERLNLDKQYSELTKPKSAVKKSGGEFAAKILKESGSKAIGAVVGALATAGAAVVVAKVFKEKHIG